MKFTAAAALLSIAALAVGATANANASPSRSRLARPAILSVTATPRKTPATGQQVVITVRVRNATTCSFFGQHVAFSALYPVKTVRCGSGSVSVTMPAVGNPSRTTAYIRYMVLARSKGHSPAERRVSVIEAGVSGTSSPTPTPAPTPTPKATPLTVVTASLPNATVGVGYAATLNASGGTPPYAWSIVSGTPPPGLTLSATGVIAGTPTAVGTTSFTVQVVDSTIGTRQTATATATINVVASPTPTGQSPNWSGYIVGGGPFTEVAGTFNMPNLFTEPTAGTTSEWVGIDGWNGNPNLIQAGVTESFDPSTNLVHWFAWYEVLPAEPTSIPVPLVIAPGNQITVTIEQLSLGSWGIWIKNDSTGQTYYTTQNYSGAGTTAEWIVEAPTTSGVEDQLAPYTPDVTFTNLGVTGTQGPLTDVVMVQNGVTVSVPSVLTPAGFTVAYGSAAPVPP